MACRHCHKPKEHASPSPVWYAGLPLCGTCMTQHHGGCPRFPRDQFVAGTTLGGLKGHGAAEWLVANGLRVTT